MEEKSVKKGVKASLEEEKAKIERWSREKLNMNEIKISNNVLMVVAIMLIVVNAVMFVVSSREVISGKASQQGYVGVCITAPLSVTTPGPSGGVLSAPYLVNVSANNTKQVRFRYFRFGEVESEFGFDTDPDNDDYYNSTFNTSAYPDGNCNYRIVVRADGPCGEELVRQSGVFSVNNIDVEPVWDEFKNSLSTNFSQYSSWTNIPGAQIAIPNAGIIKFSTNNFDGTNLDSQYEITPEWINLTATGWCQIDQTYTITFLNVSGYVEPIVLRNGMPCGPDCTNYQFVGNSLTFTSSVLFSANFSFGEGANITLNLSLDVEDLDVNLNWTYHLNNPYSTPPDYYNIYYGSNATEMMQLDAPFPTPNVTGITILNWLDTTANESDQRYYVLTAVKGSREARAPETGCKYDVKAYKGQNLVSLPCQKPELNIDDQIAPPPTSYYDRITRYVPGSGFQRTDYYGPVWRWWGFFENVENDKGYYLYPTKADYEIVSVGIVPEENRSVQIYAGLDLLGWTSVFSRDISSVLMPNSSNNLMPITRYNATTSWQRTDYYYGYGWYGWFDKFDPGRGYWYYPVRAYYNWTYDPI